MRAEGLPLESRSKETKRIEEKGIKRSKIDEIENLRNRQVHAVVVIVNRLPEWFDEIDNSASGDRVDAASDLLVRVHLEQS